MTTHATQRMHLRKVRMEWIEQTARNPEWTEPEPRYPEAERRFRGVQEFAGRVLRVVCVETETAIRVITVTFDRGAKRKL
jgi:hypothetical protein